MTYSILTYTIPSKKNRYPYHAPDLVYKHIRPSENVLISVMAYCPDNQETGASTAEVVCSTLELYFEPDIIEMLLNSSAEVISESVLVFVNNKVKKFFQQVKSTPAHFEYSYLIADFTNGRYIAFSSDGVICRGPVDNPEDLINSTGYSEGFFTAKDCFFIGNQTLANVAGNRDIAKTLAKGLAYLDIEFFDICCDVVSDSDNIELETGNAFMVFIPVF